MIVSEKLVTGLIILVVIIILISFKRLKQTVLGIFGGSIDKVELGGIIFTIAFLWMLAKEGNRTTQWYIFSELYIFIVAGAALTGLGLGKVLDHIKQIKDTAPNTKETKIEISEKGNSKIETKETKNESEAPQ
jgi:thiol:disulfide interchange protein